MPRVAFPIAHFVPALLLTASVAVIASTAAKDPISRDGVEYVYAAANFAAGRGLIVPQSALSPNAAAEMPLKNFPPGFPIAASALVKLGIPAEHAALLLTHWAWMALPLSATYVFYAMQLSPLVSVSMAATVSFAPGVIESGLNVHADLIFLNCVLLSTAMLVRHAQTRRAVWLVLSGTLAGAAYTVRNAGLAFFCAAFVFFVADLTRWPVRVAAWRHPGPWRSLLIWLAATAPWVLAVKLRALVVFGVLEPYEMPPSTMGVLENVRWFIFSTISDLTSLRQLAWLVWNKWVFGLAVILGSCAAAVAVPHLARWLASTAHRRTVLMIASYLVAGAVMLIATRTRYDWQAIIDERYVTQYSWVWFALAGLYASRDASGRASIRLFVMVCWLILGTRMTNVLELYTHPFAPVLSPSEERAAITAITNLPPDAVVVSNESATLTLATGRDVRQLGSRGAALSELLADLADVAADFDKALLYGAFVTTSPHEAGPSGTRTITAHDRFRLVTAANTGAQ